MMIRPRKHFAALATAAALGTGIASAATATFNSPSLDKWVYSNALDSGGGGSDVARVYANLGTDEDDRLSGMLVGFNTTSSITRGLGASSYAITSVKLTLTLAYVDGFIYDPTYDSYRTYLDTGDPNYLPDTDPGRPVEVFGVGLRNGYAALFGSSVSGTKYTENAPVITNGTQNVYPVGFDSQGIAYDVSDNVSQGKEAFSFGVGTSDIVTPGQPYLQGDQITFTLEISNPAVLAYLQEGLNTGVIGLFVSSLQNVSGQSAAPNYPRFLTKENELGSAFAPKLEITYAIVPEPKLSGLLIAGCALFACIRGFRQRQHLS